MVKKTMRVELELVKKPKKHDISISEIYSRNSADADRLLWGRQVDQVTRRGFLKNCGLVTMTSVLGMSIPFARYMPSGLIPAAFAAENAPTTIVGKEGLLVLNDLPLNAETPAHLLDDHITPNHRMFVRNNGIPPETIDVDNWRLEVDGESCVRPATFTLSDLSSRFDVITRQLQLECGGNGRSEFVPAASGNQWTTGAVGCPEFTGVRLADVLDYCGIKDDAIYIGYEGADSHLSGDPNLTSISRGVPLHKAMEPESLVVWQMNGQDIPLQNGYPLRLVCAGWPASVSGKWLRRIRVRNKVHDGEKMAAPSYSVPLNPVAPGSRVPNSDMRIIESMPVKSLVTFPQSGVTHRMRDDLAVRGHAWAGDSHVERVDISIDFGATWQKAELSTAANRLAWQHWQANVRFTQIGYYEVWVKATDNSGLSQPMVVPGWNPRGYLNNACHRIAVQVV